MRLESSLMVAEICLEWSELEELAPPESLDKAGRQVVSEFQELRMPEALESTEVASAVQESEQPETRLVVQSQWGRLALRRLLPMLWLGICTSVVDISTFVSPTVCGHW